MIQEINFTGHTAVPADRISPDGDLTLSVNLLNEDGHLHPIPSPRTLFTLPDGFRILCIHNPSPTVKNYIIVHPIDTATEIWFLPASLLPDTASPHLNTLITAKTLQNEEYRAITLPHPVSDCKTMGMTLLILSENPIHYLLWNPETMKYKSLGSSIPRPDIDFALELELASRTTDGEIALANPSSIQSYENSWSSIRTADLSGPFDIEWTAPTRWHMIKLSQLGLKKGKEYRFTLNRFGKKIALYVYTSDIKNILNADSYDNPAASSRILAFSYYDGPRTVIPDEDIDTLWLCVFSVYGYSSSDTVTLTIEEGLENRIDIESKIISYTPEAVNAVAAAMNLVINEEATAKNRFIYPFFVRYAVRFYDGSSYSPSAPRLMIPNSDFVPVVLFRDEAPKLHAFAFTAQLKFHINDAASLSDWKDIITGIDIFVSPSAWPYDQGVEFDSKKMPFSYLPFETVSSFGIGMINFKSTIAEYYNECYDTYFLRERATQFLDTTSYQPAAVRLGERTQEDYISRFTSAEISTFYLISTIDLDDIIPSSQFTPVDIPDNALSSLQARSVLEEPLVSTAGFSNAKAHVYNNRLHIFDASLILPTPQSLFSTNPFENMSTHNDIYQEIIVSLSTSQGEKTVKAILPAAPFDIYNDCSFWFFYPDSRAKEVTFIIEDPLYNIKKFFTLRLKSHPFLNGAYAITGSFKESLVALAEYKNDTSPEPDDKISAHSSIYISEVNNPFIFRNSSVVSVGASAIQALTSAVRPLSQGQFGQFPLYAFTDEGVWAMEISSTGTYSARQPITRDICTNPAAITQIDSVVLFPTARGIMLLAGSETRCITDTISSEYPFSLSSLPSLQEAIHSAALVSESLSPDEKNLFPSSLQLLPFSRFLSSCGIIYDYLHQRIIMYNPSARYAYVYSFRSQLWGMIQSEIESTINTYPDALAIDRSGNLISFSEEDTSEEETQQTIPAILLTRPLKLSDPEILKTIDTVITRGEFIKGHVNTLLYGSRDLLSWHPLLSSKSHILRAFRGTPYKYFRLLLICRLNPDESIHSASVSLTPRLTNRLR
ncbi:hypothetical protein HDR61_05345 [bacterium]|nr:hypothetical protein [Bacteroidales bacterium]MBD5401133.1 hypothetical protein [bacterium]